jgi:hypothetical protein
MTSKEKIKDILEFVQSNLPAKYSLPAEYGLLACLEKKLEGLVHTAQIDLLNKAEQRLRSQKVSH